jgi:hypothetical protein
LKNNALDFHDLFSDDGSKVTDNTKYETVIDRLLWAPNGLSKEEYQFIVDECFRPVSEAEQVEAKPLDKKRERDLDDKSIGDGITPPLRRKRDSDSDASEYVMPARKVIVLEQVPPRQVIAERDCHNFIIEEGTNVPFAWPTYRPKAIAKPLRWLAEPYSSAFAPPPVITKRKRDEDSDATEYEMPARKVFIFEVVDDQGERSASTLEEKSVPTAELLRPKASARPLHSLTKSSWSAPHAYRVMWKLRSRTESTASAGPTPFASIQPLTPSSPSSMGSRSPQSSPPPSSATDMPSPMTSMTSLSSSARPTPDADLSASPPVSLNNNGIPKPIPAIAAPVSFDGPSEGALPADESSGSGHRDKKALSSTKPVVTNGRCGEPQINPDSPAQAHSKLLSETLGSQMTGCTITNSSSTAHLSLAQLAADALTDMNTRPSTYEPREASDGKRNGTGARGGKPGKATTTSKSPPAKTTAMAQVPGSTPVSGGDDGSDPPKPPQTSERTAPEDKADIPLDNAEDLNKEGAFVVQYYAEPMTFEEHNEYQNAAIELKKRGNVTQYHSNKAWIAGEIRTRGLDPDMSPKRRQHVLKLYHLSESDLMVRPRGVVVSST